MLHPRHRRSNRCLERPPLPLFYSYRPILKFLQLLQPGLPHPFGFFGIRVWRPLGATFNPLLNDRDLFLRKRLARTASGSQRHVEFLQSCHPAIQPAVVWLSGSYDRTMPAAVQKTGSGLQGEPGVLPLVIVTA